MKKRIVIKNIPAKMPINRAAIIAFMLYYFKMDNIYWGIFITFYSIVFALIIYVKWNEESVDIFEDKAKSKFSERLENLMKNKK